MREIQENTQKAGRKKRKRIFLPALLAAALYLLLGAALPFVRQPSVSEKTKKKTEQYSFYGAGEGPERARILADNGEALKERIRLISQAEERIIMSTFEFRTDESGMDMLAALLDAAKRGVQVQLLVDGFAAFTNMTGNEYFMALSGMETAEIRIYSPVNPLLPWRLMGRMHDKYLIADDTAYILGGRNTYDYFLGDHDGYKNYDWDMRSAYIDTEIMLVIDSRELNGQLRQEMAEYEKEALPVADEETYDLPEGMEPQQISFKRRARIVVLRLLAGWARFLT